jgi:NADPH:quinone reductase-like Zn-dependent oxidoreductase
MLAATYDRYGPPEVLQIAQLETPKPRADEILLKVMAAGVSDSDKYIRSAKVMPQLVIPLRLAVGILRPRRRIIGIVFSGVVDSVGSKVTRFSPGDEVYGMTGFNFGVYAQYKCLKPVDSNKNGCMARKPAGIDHAEATVASYGGLLGLQAVEKAKVSKGDRVLVYGGSGTTGSLAIQICKVLGAHVTAVAGPHSQDFMRDLGADLVLDYTAENTDLGDPYDVFLDTAGKHRSSALRTRLEKHIAAGARKASIDDSALLMDSSRLDRVRTYIEDQGVRPILDRSWPLTEVVAAHRALESGPKRGGFAVTIPHDN